MIKINISLFLLLCLLTAKGQALRKFQGNYENGTATYTYYEKDFNRIYEGLFSYRKNEKEGRHTETVTALGRYHRNLKQGQWKYTFAETWFDKSRLETIEVETIEGLYDKGGKTGEWIDLFLTKNAKVAKRSVVNFKNNQLVGHFIFQYNVGQMYVVPYSNIYAEGNFDTDSKIDGTLKSNFILDQGDKFEILSKFRRGILFWYLERNSSTGEIVAKKEQTLLIDSVFKYTKIDSLLNLPDSVNKDLVRKTHTYSIYTYNAESYSKLNLFKLLNMLTEYWDRTENWIFGESFTNHNPAALIPYGNEATPPLKHLIGVDGLIDKY